MQLVFDNGVAVGSGKDFVIDPHRSPKSETAVISHCHSDHVSLNKKTRFLMSNETLALVKNIYKKAGTARLEGMAFKKKFDISGFEVSLHNSGHILGGSQVLLENSSSIAFTSDFKLQDSLIQKGAEMLKADVLVMETTFGLPQYSFPDREKVYADIGKWVDENAEKNRFVVLAGYAAGKAQELTATVNNYSKQTPLVHESVFGNNEVYEKCGVNLGGYLKLDHNLKDSNVLILPPSLASPQLFQALEFSTGRKVVSAFCTGWQHRGFFDKTFPLSDHADFNGLLEYVKQCSPKLVLTMHGFESEFAGFVQRRLGIPARPLSKKGQKTMAEFA